MTPFFQRVIPSDNQNSLTWSLKACIHAKIRSLSLILSLQKLIFKYFMCLFKFQINYLQIWCFLCASISRKQAFQLSNHSAHPLYYHISYLKERNLSHFLQCGGISEDTVSNTGQARLHALPLQHIFSAPVWLGPKYHQSSWTILWLAFKILFIEWVNLEVLLIKPDSETAFWCNAKSH